MTQPLAMTQPPTVIQRGATRRSRRIHDFWNCSFLNCLFLNCLFLNCLFLNCLFLNCLFLNCLFLNCLFLNCLSSRAKGEVAMTQPIEMT